MNSNGLEVRRPPLVLDWSKSLLKTDGKVKKMPRVKDLLHGAPKKRGGKVSKMRPVHVNFSLVNRGTGVSRDAEVFSEMCELVELLSLSDTWIPCDAAPATGARVMLHEWRLNASHKFQEIRVSISENGVAGMTYTPTHTNTHINHVCRWVGNVTAFPLAQLVLCLCLCGIWPTPCISRSPFSPSLPFTLLCVFIGGDVELRGVWCAYSTVVCVRLSRATCARCMCRGERCPTDTHFMQSKARVVRRDGEIGGRSTWTIGVAHRDCMLSANGKW